MLTAYQGTSFVSWPRLNPPIEILSYAGPGARSGKRGRGLTFTNMIPFSKALRAVSIPARAKAGELEMGRKKGALID
jgi:hypothetical protein